MWAIHIWPTFCAIQMMEHLIISIAMYGIIHILHNREGGEKMYMTREEAISIMSYANVRGTRKEVEEALRKVREGEGDRGSKISSVVFWRDVILKDDRSREFVLKHRIMSMEELSYSHYEWKLKYRRAYNHNNKLPRDEYNPDDEGQWFEV